VALALYRIRNAERVTLRVPISGQYFTSILNLPNLLPNETWMCAFKAQVIAIYNFVIHAWELVKKIVFTSLLMSTSSVLVKV
jgi:uncharacterized protein (DUF608 family)